jgi:hypothetical protein
MIQSSASGNRIARSPVTGAFYLVTEWREDSDDQIVAREKEELSDAEVVDRLGDDLPDEWREQIEADLWKEVSDEPP